MSLIVKPINAQLTKDKDTFGKQDPYCVITIGQQKQRTKTHSGGGKNPQWMDTLQFQCRDPLMRVAVYDDDFGKDDLIGEGTYNLNQIYNNPFRTENEYIDIVHHGKSAGRVLISLEFQGQGQGTNQGWGNQGNQGWGNGPNNGYGGNQGNMGNQGWGNGPNNGQGWGNNPNNGGWGNPPNNGGWGNGPNQNQGWGQQPPNNGWGNQPPQNNNGWGQQPPNNGWGQQPPNNNNNGWGNGW